MAWESVGSTELSKIADRLSQAVDATERLEAHVLQRPWYKKGAVVRLRAAEKERFYIAAGAGEISGRTFFLLDGQSDNIHAGNAAAEIQIETAEHAQDYLRFFCSFLFCADGFRFNIVDRLDEGWTVTSGRRDAIRPMELQATDDPAVFAGRASFEYAGDLFDASMRVFADGMVEMVEDDPLGTPIPLN